MVGSKSEHSGIIKDGAKMVNAVATVLYQNLLSLQVIATVQEIMQCVARPTTLD